MDPATALRFAQDDKQKVMASASTHDYDYDYGKDIQELIDSFAFSGSAYQPGCFFSSDSSLHSSQAYEKAIPSSRRAFLNELLYSTL